MYRNVTIHLVTIFFFSQLIALRGQEKLQTVTVKRVSKEDGFTIGSGVSLDRITKAYSSPFIVEVDKDGNRKDVVTSVDPGASFLTHVVTNTSSLDAGIGTNVEAKAHFLFTKIEAKTEFDRRSQLSEESFKLVIVGDSSYGDDILQNPKLKEEALKLIQAGKMEEFSNIYGTHYVKREHRVAKIAVTIGVERWSSSTLQKLRIQLKGSTGFILGGGELKASIHNDIKEAASGKKLDVQVSTIGGAGLESFGDVVKAVLTNSNDFEATVGEAIKAILIKFNRSNSGIGSVTIAPYTEFGWDPLKISLWNDRFEQKLQKCADLYYEGRQIENAVSKFVMPKYDEEIAKQLKGLATAFDSYLRELAIFQEKLLAKDQTYVSKEFPKEPEIDPALAKSIIKKFKSLSDPINVRTFNLWIGPKAMLNAGGRGKPHYYLEEHLDPQMYDLSTKLKLPEGFPELPIDEELIGAWFTPRDAVYNHTAFHSIDVWAENGKLYVWAFAKKGANIEEGMQVRIHLLTRKIYK